MKAEIEEECVLIIYAYDVAVRLPCQPVTVSFYSIELRLEDHNMDEDPIPIFWADGWAHIPNLRCS